jgi:lipid-A-disaccharide synthase
VRLIKEKTYEILYISEAALVKSGTATLETALFNVPQVVCFKGDFFSMVIAWIVIKVKYISLVNLIAGYEAVKELVQYSLNEKNIVSELRAVLPGGPKRDKMLEDYNKVREILGPAGASERVAEDMVRVLRHKGMMA